MATTTIVAYFNPLPMKTAEEWTKELDNKANYVSYYFNWDKAHGVIKAIQLDAWKQGMLDAAQLGREFGDFPATDDGYDTRDGIVNFIELKANERSTIDNS